MTASAELNDLMPRLGRFVSRHVRNGHTAQVITQNVLLKVHRHHHRLPQKPRRVRAWALTARAGEYGGVGGAAEGTCDHQQTGLFSEVTGRDDRGRNKESNHE